MLRRLIITLLLCSSLFAQVKAKISLTTTNGPTVTLTCTAPTGGTTPNSYNFLYSFTNGGPYTQLANMPTCGPFQDTTQAFGATVYYVAASVNTATCPASQAPCVSGFSNQVTVVMPGSPIPNPPSNLQAGTPVAENIPLQWNAPVVQSGVVVDWYELWRCHESTCPDPPKVAIVKGTSYSGTCPYSTGLCWWYVTAMDTVNGKQIRSRRSSIVATK